MISWVTSSSASSRVPQAGTHGAGRAGRVEVPASSSEKPAARLPMAKACNALTQRQAIA